MWLRAVTVPLGLNVAVTEVSLAKVTVQTVEFPVQPPPVKPANVDPEFGAAVSVTAVPLAKLALHVVPQVIPAGELLTDPAPVPAATTLS
jgi:hypothetical protein